jgi:hypothetical protein
MKHYAMKAYRGVVVEIHIFLTSVSGQLHAPAAHIWDVMTILKSIHLTDHLCNNVNM